MKHAFRLPFLFVTLSSGASVAQEEPTVQVDAVETPAASVLAPEGPAADNDDESAPQRVDPEGAVAHPGIDASGPTNTEGNELSSQAPAATVSASAVADEATVSVLPATSSLVDVRLPDGRGPFR
ncbi:MAG: hypothetical protein ACO3JL_21300, partial [Myxococcota bacterium]